MAGVWDDNAVITLGLWWDHSAAADVEARLCRDQSREGHHRSTPCPWKQCGQARAREKPSRQEMDKNASLVPHEIMAFECCILFSDFWNSRLVKRAFNSNRRPVPNNGGPLRGAVPVFKK